jgi:hypothetical protein
MTLDDPRRLSAFHDQRIDTTLDPTLTALVARVAKEGDAPIAVVSLVMDRVQYFRAAVGLPTELALAGATNRCDSFCQFVVKEEKLFIIEDAPKDPRIPQVLVERYGIIAYAGAPIFFDGHVLGSLCVFDIKPRQFSPAFLESLTQAAAEASTRLAQLAAWESEPLSAAEPVLSAQEMISQAIKQLTNLAAAIELGTPLLNDLAQLPRQAWSVELLGQEAEKLAEAAFFYRTVADRFKRLQAIVYRLARTSLVPQKDSPVPSLLQDIRVLGRILAEGLTFVRVIEALASDALSAADTARVLSVLHVALGFSSDLRASLAIALADARSLHGSPDKTGGTP